MHPNGQLPAYEWAFGDVNPPVHAWAALRVYQIDRRTSAGTPTGRSSSRVFHKLMLNFTWWVNRKDAAREQRLRGGLPRARQHRRLRPLERRCPAGGVLEQADATSWMGMYCLNLLDDRARARASENPSYQDVANKFFEHFLSIAHAMNNVGRRGDPRSGTRRTASSTTSSTCPDGASVPLRVRSMVGLIPLFAVDDARARRCSSASPAFVKRMRWFLENRAGATPSTSRSARRAGGRRSGGSSRSSDAKRLDAHPVARSSTRTSSSRRTACARSRAVYKDHPYVVRVIGGREHRVDVRAGRVVVAACSAATRTGAARCGSR